MRGLACFFLSVCLSWRASSCFDISSAACASIPLPISLGKINKERLRLLRTLAGMVKVVKTKTFEASLS